MDKKAALELSVNFIVILIVSILILSLGLFITFSLVSRANSQADQILEKTHLELQQAANTDKEIVVVDSSQQGSAGKNSFFGIGIINRIEHNTKFRVITNFSRAFDRNEQEINNSYSSTIQITNREIDIGELSKDQGKESFVGINIPKGSPSGTYAFNVYVCINESSNPSEDLCPRGWKKRAVRNILLTI